MYRDEYGKYGYYLLVCVCVCVWRGGGLMVSVFDSRLGGPGSSPGRGHCVVFLGKTLYSHSASLHPGVQMDTSKYAGVTLQWISIPSRGE